MYKTTKRREVANEEDISLPASYFHQGTNYHAYECLGVHRLPGNADQYVFRVWAPYAKYVSLISDFTDWTNGLPMVRITDDGIWECKCEGHLVGDCYKFRIVTDNGVLEKADPFAFESETLYKTASIVPTDEMFVWSDHAWMEQRGQAMDVATRYFYPSPMLVYQLHLGSFLTRDGRSTKGDSSAYLNYREIGMELIPYLKQLGCTHVQLLPIMEHSDDVSLGYHAGAFYAPTGRYGTPHDFRFFVDQMHKHNIGVLLDWNPAFFAGDAHGLSLFDGSALYEQQDSRNDGQKVARFALSRGEVQSFLISNALFWMREYHIDGLRVHAIESMGKNDRRQAEFFLQKLNSAVTAEFPDVLMIAGAQLADLPLTTPVSMGGLGFHLQWQTSWASDLLYYVGADPLFRKYDHNRLTRTIDSASFGQHNLLPISHELALSGKGSLISRHFGDWRMQFAGMRATLAYQMAHPGKKLLFMGCEFGQFRQWDPENQLEWFMLDHDTHRSLLTYTADLGQLYRGASELWEIDFDAEGFTWIAADRKDEDLLAFRRRNRKGSSLLCFFNFSPLRQEGVTFALQGDKQSYAIVWNSDDLRWGGSGTPCRVSSQATENGHQITLDLPGLSAVFLRPMRGKLKGTPKASPERSTVAQVTGNSNL